MSFNRRDRRPDRDRNDRPARQAGGGDWQRDRPAGDRPYQPRGGDRPYQPRGGDRPAPRGGDRPFTPRPRFDRPPDEGAMSIRLDPRRVNALKHLAGEAGVRPGDLVRQWVEERLDASRGIDAPAGATANVATRIDELAARISALEAAGGTAAKAPPPKEQGSTGEDASSAGPRASKPGATKRARRSPKTVSAKASGERVALHDEMIAVLRERGPMSAAELASAVTERGRYAPPRSGKAIDAAMVSQRVSNPTYRSRFVRNEGRIGLAE